MTSRQAIIDRLVAEIEADANHPEQQWSPEGLWCGWSMTLAGVRITNLGAIAKHARMQLERRLPAVETFKTCEDFAHLNVKCDEDCHGTYAMHEMEVTPLPEGGYAWVCCAIDHAIRPEWHAEQGRLFDQSEKGKALRALWPDMYDANGNRRPFHFEKINEKLSFPWERSDGLQR